MKRVAMPLVLCALIFRAAPLVSQTAPQTGVQTGTQIGVQTGTQTTIQAAPPTVGPTTSILPSHTLIPIPMPVITQGQMELLKLEGDFSEATTKGGGKAFSAWFADDGVTLSNGKRPVQGLRAIRVASTWDPKTYQLSWYAEGAQMGSSNDTGFTWGHYDATTIAPDGKSSTASGRYITVWKKVNGKWKVALDASANEPPDPLVAPPAAMPLTAPSVTPAATPPR
jgi:ketosteroid isomerase-like protein